MAVYTKINKRDISSINNQFEIEKIIDFNGITKGIENTNYLLKTKKNKFILTIFEKRVLNKEIPFFMRLMEILNGSNINCPKPLKNKNGSYLIKLRNKTACIVSFLNGKDKIKLNSKNCFAVGKMIAKIHQATKSIKISRKNSMGIKELGPLLKSIKFKTKRFSNLQKFLTNNLKEIEIISNLDLMISMDSANGHIAANYNIPVITLWGLTHPFAGFSPFLSLSENMIVSNREQYPQIPTSAYGNKTPKGYEDIMKTIEYKDVIVRALKILERPKQHHN